MRTSPAATFDEAAPCPCGVTLPYRDCCGPLHAGAAAPTAERLMRSRYVAYALGDAPYLVSSWHPSTRPSHVDLDPSQQWVELTLHAVTGGQFLDVEGTVQFTARCTVDGRPGAVHETSVFARDGRRWAYVGPTPTASSRP